jgi:hypothetical protein
MAGIENLKSTLGGVIKVVKTVDGALEDKKVSIIEGARIAVAGIQFWMAVKKIAEIKAELIDLTPEEKTELYDYFVDEFDLRNDDVESFIEQIVFALTEMSGIFDKIK